jgi:HEAT repeat protein
VDALTPIITHQSTMPPSDFAALLDEDLNDGEPVVRQAALDAVISHAAGPRFSTDQRARDEWQNERSALQSLRARVILLLGDPVAKVRDQAIRALASLDFDPQQPLGAISPQTEQLYVQLFQVESEPSVRARIVDALGTSGHPIVSPQAAAVILRGFDDPEAFVRHSATHGAMKIPFDAAVPKLLQRLHDENWYVREAAAQAFQKFGGRANQHLPALQNALAGERQPEVVEALKHAIDDIQSQVIPPAQRGGGRGVGRPQ